MTAVMERKATVAGVAVSARKMVAWWLLMVAAIGFVATGLYTVSRGIDARGQVRDQLAAENIVTPEDASIPNAKVLDAATAESQADIIQHHMLNTTKGKTYAELGREDPVREVAFKAAALRTALFAAVLADGTAQLAMGVGAFIAAVGLLMLVSLVLLRPARN